MGYQVGQTNVTETVIYRIPFPRGRDQYPTVGCLVPSFCSLHHLCGNYFILLQAYHVVSRIVSFLDIPRFRSPIDYFILLQACHVVSRIVCFLDTPDFRIPIAER